MNKFIKVFYLFLVSILLTSCVAVEEKDWKDGTATLIGYKVSKHNHIFIKVNETNTLHDIDGLGRRREPIIPLGGKFHIKYYVSPNGHVYVHRGYIRNQVRRPIEYKYGYFFLPNYHIGMF